jgi:aminopeptidase N
MTIFRKNYQAFPYLIPKIDLCLDLDAEQTQVRSQMRVVRQAGFDGSADLILKGENIELVELRVNGQPWSNYLLSEADGTLVIRGLEKDCQVEIISHCAPGKNDSLMGLYVSGESLFTQCEPEGFRRITWFPDRPDVMSEYAVTLRADKKQYPTLLSNGNLVSASDLPNGRHEVQWLDPFPKPSYLFALVAGTFECRQHHCNTQSGKSALLQIYSDPGTLDRTEWAMESLERSLKWDESRFGLELDLERFMIVAARDFNMGAMENKGLNIFNSAYVLADPQTATDANYQAIEAVIGHEYFHNWTGNRVTCRDWFQLSLKEGLTVFRDQEFTADMLASGVNEAIGKSARAVKRIDDIVTLRAAQFPEDAGPMAHPIRPESYQEISNFYTATVYEKGAEVIRMMHTMLGESTFQLGMKEYFRRHDGQAVTCDDFIAAMQWALQQKSPHRDLVTFSRWYSQAGTPKVKVSMQTESGICRLTLGQTCEPVGVEKTESREKMPFHIPLAVGFLSGDGKPLTVTYQGKEADTLLLELTEQSTTFAIEGVTPDAIPSLNRGFSAPVHTEFDYTDGDLSVLAAHDTDSFSRWEALQTLFARHLLKGTPEPDSIERIRQVCIRLLSAQDLDPAYLTRLLTLPSDKYLLQLMDPMLPLELALRKQALEVSLGQDLSTLLLARVDRAELAQPYSPMPEQSGKRALRNLALNLLCQAAEPTAKQLAYHQYEAARNMTDRLGALRALLLHPVRDDRVADALTSFYERFQGDPLVIDKWFALQATSPGMSIDTVRGLMAHPSFDRRNPNRLRALVFQFCLNNPIGFHVPDGSGYMFWAEQVIITDQTNPEIAARLARALDHWTHHAPDTQKNMHHALEKIAQQEGLSPNTREIVSKALTL